MGRRTFESIGRPLPGRPNIVISRENGLHELGVIAVSDKQTAMAMAEREARACGTNEIMIIGGAEIFALFGEEVSRVYLTEIDTVTRGDAFFDRDFSDWSLVCEQTYPRTVGGDEFDFVVRVYDKPAARCVQGTAGEKRPLDLIAAE